MGHSIWNLNEDGLMDISFVYWHVPNLIHDAHVGWRVTCPNSMPSFVKSKEVQLSVCLSVCLLHIYLQKKSLFHKFVFSNFYKNKTRKNFRTKFKNCKQIKKNIFLQFHLKKRFFSLFDIKQKFREGLTRHFQCPIKSLLSLRGLSFIPLSIFYVPQKSHADQINEFNTLHNFTLCPLLRFKILEKPFIFWPNKVWLRRVRLGHFRFYYVRLDLIGLC